ncbi:MAG TPA: methionine--tRNA ligase, partial [Candidatus Manganitrophaceae bacterium]|nr:methionine--tRNA ligase [Candidatus Manganitrophaceae bacterium]
MNQEKFYITTPIYYVNDAPHIGHAYTTLAADVLARWRRLQRHEVFFLTGTDEHGQKVEQAAAKRGVSPQRHADELVVHFQDLWKRLQVSNDDFVRTTEDRHQKVVQEVLQRLWDKKEIYEDTYEGWYCLPDERFWTEKDLVDGKCPDCGRPVAPLAERNYFFKMGQYQERLKRHIRENSRFIQPESRRNEVLGFLEKPLGDLCISRPKSRLAWGIPIPFAPDYVTYVWLDALVNYISIPGYATDPDRFQKWWPADLHLVGKDILTTHAVYWTTILMALDLPLPMSLFAHGWWTVNGEKMSKSRGNVVNPVEIIETFGVDAFRYFLFREVPFGQDGDFSKEALINRINSDLANDLGNLLSRTLNLVEQFTEGVIPGPSFSHPEEEEVKNIARGLFNPIEDAFDRLEFHLALGEIWKLVNRTNAYIEQMSPWKLAKKTDEKEKLQTVLYTAAEALRFIALYLRPFMPQTAREMERQLGLPASYETILLEKGRAWGGHLVNIRIAKGRSLFPRIDKKQQLSSSLAAAPAPSPSKTVSGTFPPIKPPITIDDFAKLDLRVGLILAAERVPNSKKLLKLQVDIGSERRQVVA